MPTVENTALPMGRHADLIRWLIGSRHLCWCNCRTPNIPGLESWLLQLVDCGGRQSHRKHPLGRQPWEPCP